MTSRATSRAMGLLLTLLAGACAALPSREQQAPANDLAADPLSGSDGQQSMSCEAQVHPGFASGLGVWSFDPVAIKLQLMPVLPSATAERASGPTIYGAIVTPECSPK